MPATFPAPHNVFVPSHEATNGLIVDFARNIRDFAVNRYSQVIPVTRVGGIYLEMTVEEAGRILNSNLSDFVWYDGQPAPEGNDGTEKFEFKQYQCQCYSYSFTIGHRTTESADWEILAQHASIKARQAMTARTQLVASTLFDSSNYDATHVLDRASAKWDAATTSNLNIRKAINLAARKIMDATLSAVGPQNLVLVVSDAVAAAMAESQEIVDYLKGSPDALGALRYQYRDETPDAEAWGLPRRLYGVEVVVDSTRKVTTKKKATAATREAVLPSNQAVLCSRVGGLEAPYGPMSFSTVGLFMKEEMTVEQLNDVNNRRTLGRVVEDFDVKMMAPGTAVLLDNVV